MKKQKQKRMTFAKRVEAESKTLHALEVAQHGRVLSPIERSLKNYLRFRRGKGRRTIFRAVLANSMIEAIDSGDLDSLRAVIAGVKEFSVSFNDLGSHRADIIAMKGVLQEAGRNAGVETMTMTVPHLAKLLLIPETADGFKALRTLCIRLKFPIKEAKRGPK